MNKNLKPTRHSSHRKEDQSKRAFEELIDPFFVSGWNPKDYGIDAVVEITTNNNRTNDVELESKCFLLQLKSTEELKQSNGAIPLSIPTKKITYWYDYNLPVLLALYDIKNNQFFIQWINDDFIGSLEAQNANWVNQQTVTIKIPTNSILTKDTISSLREYVLKWKMPARRTLKPGAYFELKDRAEKLIDEYSGIVSPFAFRSINESVINIQSGVEKSIYRIALTGLSRVGKSSLINSLLKKEISPTGFYQTTGVPIQIIPGTEDKIHVYFQDGHSKSYPFSKQSITEYASQELNEDNKKLVKLVSISVSNESLERGVSLYDIPGLDDPNDDILEYTWQTIKKANAIIYVIDASPAESGGYIFKNEYKKHITTFSQSQDKVFLVFNKVDKLSKDVLLSLKERVKIDLKKHDLSESIGSRVFYLSAEGKVQRDGINSVEQLSETIWSFILSENKFGIINLRIVNQELSQSTKELIDILKTRLLDDEKRKKLEDSIKEIQNRLPTLSSTYRQQHLNSKKLLNHSLDVKYSTIITNLESTLKALPLDKELPNSTEIKKYLVDGLQQSIEQLNNEYALQINELKILIDNWIEENLKQVKEIISENVDTKYISFTELDKFESPQVDLSSAWGMGLLGVAFGLLAAPAMGLLGGIIGFFGNLITSAESHRAKRIGKILDKSRERCAPEIEKLKTAYSDLIEEHTKIINTYINRRTNLYFNDLQIQMTKLNEGIKAEEVSYYKEAFSKIEHLQSRILKFDAELQSYQFTNS